MNTRILVVDDAKATRTRPFGVGQFQVDRLRRAENGRAGVRKFRELKPDLVLLDLAMPDIDGIEAARQMHAVNPSVPLILFTLTAGDRAQGKSTWAY
jgi:CheY-like chemotaxis protein